MEATETYPEIKLPFEEEFEALIRKEYGRLSDQGHTYLDYTGGNLYAQSQIDAHHRLLSENVFGNPHSTNPTSSLATSLVKKARQKVIDFFHARDYFCVFTQNASGALKIIGESYPFEEDGRFVLLSDNHNSVNGIREYCKRAGGTFDYAPVTIEDLQIDKAELSKLLEDERPYQHKLFAFPAQSNVSGVQHDLEWVERAQHLGWDVLLDAAAFVPTSKLDLRRVKPDFVSISFYKIFGYPTGLGCLLVRKDKFHKLHKRWFAGGTVTLAAVRSPHFYLAEDHERFENGTINYLDIPAITIGLEHIESIGMDKIHKRTKALADYLYESLQSIRHANGKPVVRVHGPTDRSHVGGTLIMNFYDDQGKTIPFEEVEAKANARKISIRSGCFCNPGVDEVNNCITTQELAEYFTSHSNGDYHDMVHFLHKMRGATRVSLGLATRGADIKRFVTFTRSFRM